MTQLWEPGVQYELGSEVIFEGSKYKIIQPHRSQSDWTPTVTPALWGKVPGGGYGHDHGNQPGCQPQQPSYGQPSHQPPKPAQPSYGGAASHGGSSHQPQQGNYAGGWEPPKPTLQTGYGGQHPDQKVQIKPEEQKKSWYDLDESRRKEVAIGGGLLAGAAAVGAGYFVYKHHEKNEEEKEALAWAVQNWLKDAQARANDFKCNGPRGPATWVLTEGKNIPPGAIVIGQEKNTSLYACRAFQDGSIQVGKASPSFREGGVIGYADEEIEIKTFEVLVGDMRGLRWVNASGKLNLQSLGARPVEGGRDKDGTSLYVAKAFHKGGEHPGKCGEKLDGAWITYGGDEKSVKEYQVLCYA